MPTRKTVEKTWSVPARPVVKVCWHRRVLVMDRKARLTKANSHACSAQLAGSGAAFLFNSSPRDLTHCILQTRIHRRNE